MLERSNLSTGLYLFVIDPFFTGTLTRFDRWTLPLEVAVVFLAYRIAFIQGMPSSPHFLQENAGIGHTVIITNVKQSSGDFNYINTPSEYRNLMSAANFLVWLGQCLAELALTQIVRLIVAELLCFVQSNSRFRLVPALTCPAFT
jgi:hypothetical protein